MRIAIDIRKIGLKGTGDEVYTYYLVKELTGLVNDQKHDFFLLTDKPVSMVKKFLPSMPPNFKIFEIKPRAKMFWTFYSLPRFLAKNPVDVLHVQYVSPFYLSKKIKIITTIHDVSFRVNPKWIKRKDSLLLNVFIPLTLRRVDGVITVSEFSKKEISERFKFPQERIFVTKPAVDFRLFGEKKLKDDKIKEILGDQFPFILHVSSMQPRKNVPLVIKAFSNLKEKWEKEKSVWKKTKLVIIGKRNGYNYDEEIDQAVEKSDFKNDIIFAGYVEAKKLPLFYSRARLFIFPSSYEGFGIPLLESMLSGTPVLASNIGSFKEIDGGKNIVAMADIKKSKQKIVEELAKKAKKLVEDETVRNSIIKLGKKRAKDFSWKILAKKTLEAYDTIVD